MCIIERLERLAKSKRSSVRRWAKAMLRDGEYLDSTGRKCSAKEARKAKAK